MWIVQCLILCRYLKRMLEVTLELYCCKSLGKLHPMCWGTLCQWARRLCPIAWQLRCIYCTRRLLIMQCRMETCWIWRLCSLTSQLWRHRYQWKLYLMQFWILHQLGRWLLKITLKLCSCRSSRPMLYMLGRIRTQRRWRMLKTSSWMLEH